MAVYAESWDDSGNLWKFGHATMYLMPEIPAMIAGTLHVLQIDTVAACGKLAPLIYETVPQDGAQPCARSLLP